MANRPKRTYTHSGVVFKWNKAALWGVVKRDDGKICPFFGTCFDAGRGNSTWPKVGDEVTMVYNNDFQLVAIFLGKLSGKR